jgi:hypothetical protein
MTVRLRPIHASDLRSLGGEVGVVSVRDHFGEHCFRINHISRGQDLVWLSARICDENCAITCAEVLAEYLGAAVRR